MKEKLIAQDRDITVRVTSTTFAPGWEMYDIHLSTEKGEVTFGHYDVFPIIRLLTQAFDFVLNDEEKDLAAEALPA